MGSEWPIMYVHWKEKLVYLTEGDSLVRVALYNVVSCWYISFHFTMLSKEPKYQ
jgi:hypothetical protein